MKNNYIKPQKFIMRVQLNIYCLGVHQSATHTVVQQTSWINLMLSCGCNTVYQYHISCVVIGHEAMHIAGALLAGNEHCFVAMVLYLLTIFTRSTTVSKNNYTLDYNYDHFSTNTCNTVASQMQWYGVQIAILCMQQP